ncbi:MAG: uroporphyrinogen-III synthase [Flavobacteriia bacterium]
MIRSLFISRDPEEVTELSAYCQDHSIDLIAHSQIRFEALAFTVTTAYDVVFFASIRAAAYFLKEVTPPSTTLYACIGRRTAEKLKTFGIHCHFVGDQSGKPEKVAAEFKNWVWDRTVLFPQSSRSNRSISSILDPVQCTEVAVYATLSDCKPVRLCDAYVFSSPSNLESFLSCNAAPAGKIIAWGETTRKAAEKKGLNIHSTLSHSEYAELISILPFI